MKKLIVLCLIIIGSAQITFAQGPEGRSFGLGVVLGEPYGATSKIWTTNTNAFAISVGGSYYGALRIGMDYLWHFNSFNSSQWNFYAGPGLVLGFGSLHDGWWYSHDRWIRQDASMGVAVRGVFGVDFMPRNSPIEFFMEAGPLINVSPGSFSAVDFAFGVRVYP